MAASRPDHMGPCERLEVALFGGIEVTGEPCLENVRKLDLLPMGMIRDIERRGIAIDREWFRDLSGKMANQLLDLKGKICEFIPEEKLGEFIGRNKQDDDAYMPMNPNSRGELSTLLFDVLEIGKGRDLKTTKGGTRISTGKKQLEQLKRSHQIIPLCLLYAEIHKLKTTYADTLPEIAIEHKAGWCGRCKDTHVAATWRIHTEILTTRTSTGRKASKNPNLQNIPSRTAMGREIRKGFIASPGMRFVSADVSQEEMRLGAHYSRDKNLIRIFEQGIDPHNETAKMAFKTDTPDYLTQRTPSRNVNFGVFYGLGGPGLYDLMAITYATAGLDMPDWLDIEWCEGFIRKWFEELYPDVLVYLEEQYYRARRYGRVWTLMGRTRLVPEVQSFHKYIQSAGLRQAGNHPIQGTGADMMDLIMGEVQEHLVQLRREGVKVWPSITVHDDLMLEVEEEWADFVKDLLSSVMSECMTDKQTGENYLRVPLRADGKVMARWEKG